MAQRQSDWFEQQKTEAQQDWFASQGTAEQGPPEPSVMDERGIVDKAADFLPSIGGAVTGFLSRAKGTPVGAIASGAGAAVGELGRQGIRLAQGRGDEVPDTLPDALKRAGKIGLMNAAQEAGGRMVIGGLSRVAPKFMRGALGAQTQVRKDFPDVDLDQAAVNARVIPGSAKSLRKVEQTGAQHAARVRNNLRVEDIKSGNAPVAGYDDAVSELRKRAPDARMAARGGATDELEAVRGGVRKVQGMKSRPLNAEETFVSKQGHQKTAAAAYRAKPGAEGEFGAEVSDDIARGLNAPLRNKFPQYAEDMQKAQEMIALERALFNAAPRTSLLRDSMGGAAGAGAGLATLGATGDPLTSAAMGIGTVLANRALTGTGALGRYALAADGMSKVMQGPGARVPDAITRQMLLELLMGNGQDK
jgi:hypothetical protein